MSANSRLGPGPRLAIALILALCLVGVGGYMVLSHELRSDQVESYDRIQQADARGLEAIAGNRSLAASQHEIDQFLGAIAGRDGTEETILIAPDRRVVASGAGAPAGAADDDPRTLEVLREGASFAGNEADVGEDNSSFEFLVPVTVDGRRYALETAYNSARFEDQLAHMRMVIALVIVAAIVIALPLFYLIGGRSLLRSHRLALERATRDGLTDLPNQRAFQDELEQATALASRNGEPLALAVIDLDRFKQVNDRNGHPAGDLMLRRVAGTLRDGRAADRPYRIGGDEFALLLQGTDEEGARTLSRRLCKRLSEEGTPCSVGVATLRSGQHPNDLRSEADEALYESKRRGGGRATLFADIRSAVEVLTVARRNGVERLVEEGNPTTVFQPIWSFDTDLLIGLEAFSRPDPSYGLSGPAEAFDIAQRIARVHELDELCVRTALRSAATALPPQALLFLNVAPKTLELDAGAVGWLTALVEDAGLAPHQLVIEVTERLQAHTPSVVDSLTELRSQGFAVALDDVGTGNSGLEMLRSIGADYVKLDSSIVGGAATDPNARAVLMAMATYARQTGAFVIAEGIEDSETLSFMRRLEALELSPKTIVQGGQGYRLGPPMPLSQSIGRSIASG